MKANKVAEYLLSLSEPDYGDYISNLKLQKLLYYSQGFHLALTGEPLFEEEVLNWLHGPVVREVYNIYKENGAKAIEINPDADFSEITEDQKAIIKDVYETYGQFSASRLRDMTHNERPWASTERNEVISKSSMKEFFKDYIVEGE